MWRKSYYQIVVKAYYKIKNFFGIVFRKIVAVFMLLLEAIVHALDWEEHEEIFLHIDILALYELRNSTE